MDKKTCKKCGHLCHCIEADHEGCTCANCECKEPEGLVDDKTVFDKHRELVKEGKLDNIIQEDQERAESASYENESGLSRTVQIPLKEYDELKSEQHFIKDKTLIDIIDNIERLVRALRKHIIRKQ